MAENTKIAWADHTQNFWTGCTKVGPGCDHCYAESWAKRSGIVQWGPDAARRRTSGQAWAKPLKWNAEHEAFQRSHGRRQRVFASSLSDFFDNAVPLQWRLDAFDVIEHTPHLDWLLLTKRIGNVRGMVPPTWLELYGWPSNVWIGATVVNQEEADRDIPKLLALPARVRFLSIEPMLGPIDLFAASPAFKFDTVQKIHWIIAGGESGAHHRPADIEWFRSLREQCKSAGVPFLMKQLGGNPDKRDRVEEFPEDLRVQRFPA